MKTRTALLCACTLVLVFLVVEVPCAPKSKVNARNWGPQSMMYLKGKYGRRHVADYDEDQLYQLIDLSDWDLPAKGPQKRGPLGVRNYRRMLTTKDIQV